MATEWYCRLMGSELGPFSSKQLLEMARQHQITPDDSVRKGADGTWVGAHRVKGLFEDPAASTIIMAHLPPDVQQALEKKQQVAESTTKSEPPKVTWHYIVDHNKIGPLSFDQLVAHGREGSLKPHCRVWSSKSPKWCEAKDVAGLVFDKATSE
ncbi:DUF4339 domain-containing protein [Bythopirellula goksoeyrii]|uniref:GYF domain-containing protein n=1 Tax=Bythopirellula goksoeyrii TaxID=1400387 RepID=A0A5B9Q2V0_9BACT|nr:DUF4339 domain-containing protein [Bythopirellula goksoeyrii]QEG33348.1 hypothetical protein Pr1d_06090 [Bythopirellula goksoeyrii]